MCRSRHFERVVPVSGNHAGKPFYAGVVISNGKIITCAPILRRPLKDDMTVDGLCRVVKEKSWKLEVC